MEKIMIVILISLNIAAIVLTTDNAIRAEKAADRAEAVLKRPVMEWVEGMVEKYQGEKK